MDKTTTTKKTTWGVSSLKPPSLPETERKRKPHLQPLFLLDSGGSPPVMGGRGVRLNRASFV
jgi:hypothetical protein